MAFSPTDSTLYAHLFGDAVLSRIFSDEQLIVYLLRVEAALARVQSRLGIIPVEVDELISAASTTVMLDWSKLQQATAEAGFPIIELVRQLRSVAQDAGKYVHWGATTQDIMDTALVLQVRDVLAVIEPKLSTLIRHLAHLAEKHRNTLMAGRTHSQHALPIPFALKIANWLAPLLRHRQRLVELRPRLLVVQLGGAAGTLAALGDQGLAVQTALAEELGLGQLTLPWHTQRDGLAEFAGWLSLLSGSLAKMAQDIILLAQSEVGEVNESADRTRGGSSTMPQKSNPIHSELVVAAARANATLLSSLHHALIQEHERATHGWQLEWLTLPQMIAHTASALNHSLFLSENVVIDAQQMAHNVAASQGMMLAERLVFALSDVLEASLAKQLVTDAVEIARREGRHLVDVVQEQSGLALEWQSLKDERSYWGVAHEFIDRVLAGV